MIHFEDKINEINEALEKKRNKWDLNALASVDYDDIKQIIMTHIYKKWHLWDQNKPIEPWLNRVVSNQFKNLLRNYYGNYARPCLNCPYNSGGNLCSFTASGTQSTECSDYKKWTQKKKSAYDIKLPLSMDNHYCEVESKRDNFVDLKNATTKLEIEMKKILSEKQFVAYQMLFVQNYSEKEVAQYLGYKTSEKKRVAGYKQIKNLKKMLREKAEDIVKNQDII
jgi:DNA-directed RNA polymerase specialized sigma24 family protein